MAEYSSDNEDEMVYIDVKDESNNKKYKIPLISYVKKNDTWIIDSGQNLNILNIMMEVV